MNSQRSCPRGNRPPRLLSMLSLVAIALALPLGLGACDALLEAAIKAAGGEYQAGTAENPVILALGQSLSGEHLDYNLLAVDSWDWRKTICIELRVPAAGDYSLLVQGENVAEDLEISRIGFTEGSTYPGERTGYTSTLHHLNNMRPGSYWLRYLWDGGKIAFSFDSSNPANEGSLLDPVQLTFGQARAGKVGGSDASLAQRSSYYLFSVDSDRVCDISLSLDSGGTPPTCSLESIGAYHYFPDFTGSMSLNFSAGDYLLIVRGDSTNSSLTYSILIGNHTSLAEGSVGTPLALALGSPVTLRAGTSTTGDGTSWYSLTIPAPGTYSLRVDEAHACYLYTSDDATFSTWDNDYYVNSYGVPQTYYEKWLAAGTIYLRFVNLSSLDTDLPILVDAYAPRNEGSVASPVTLPLGIDNALVAGNNISFDQFSYYKVTIAVAGTYHLTCTSTGYITCYWGTDSSFVSYTRYWQGGSNIPDLILSTGTYYLKYYGGDSTPPATTSFRIEALP